MTTRVVGWLCWWAMATLPVQAQQRTPVPPDQQRRAPVWSEPAPPPQAVLITVGYAPHLPAGNLADDYGNNFTFSLDVSLLTKGRWILGADGMYVFGGAVRTDVLAQLRNPEGNLTNQFGGVGDVRLDQRGWYFGSRADYLLPLLRNNPHRQGLNLGFGIGWLMHRINIRDVDENVPQLQGEYRKGYDRLTTGMALKQFVGYRFLDRRRFINFYAGAELIQGFTRNRRSWDYHTLSQLRQPRLDVLLGFRIGWTLPIYLHTAHSADDTFY